MTFCTALNCMDGRVQLPVNKYLRKRFDSEYVDTITEAGINKVLGESSDLIKIESIMDKVKISVDVHKSNSIAIIGHHDCAGNPVTKQEQIEHIKNAVNYVKQEYNNVEVIGLWVDQNWEVIEL